MNLLGGRNKVIARLELEHDRAHAALDAARKALATAEKARETAIAGLDSRIAELAARFEATGDAAVAIERAQLVQTADEIRAWHASSRAKAADAVESAKRAAAEADRRHATGLWLESIAAQKAKIAKTLAALAKLDLGALSEYPACPDEGTAFELFESFPDASWATSHVVVGSETVLTSAGPIPRDRVEAVTALVESDAEAIVRAARSALERVNAFALPFEEFKRHAQQRASAERERREKVEREAEEARLARELAAAELKERVARETVELAAMLPTRDDCILAARGDDGARVRLNAKREQLRNVFKGDSARVQQCLVEHGLAFSVIQTTAGPRLLQALPDGTQQRWDINGGQRIADVRAGAA